jgi:hypothetical protein
LHTLVDGLRPVLTDDECRDFLDLDLLVTGKLRDVPAEPDVWLAMEISAVVDGKDVERALRRASLLRQAGYRAVPVVAGEKVTLGGKKAAREQNVVLLRDGHLDFWDEALSAWGNI